MIAHLAVHGVISVLVCGSSACGDQLHWTTAELGLSQLDSCELGEIERLSVRASGYFPSQRRDGLTVDGPLSIESFPDDTRYLAVEAELGGEPDATAAGVLPLPDGDIARPLLLLPLTRSCPLADSAVAAPLDAAVAALADGSLLIVGGSERGEQAASSSALLLPAGEQLGAQVPDGMLLRRAGASATAIGDTVVVIGGAAAASGPAHEAFEIYDRASGRFDAARSGKLALGPRRDHAARALPDGRVLVAGGRSALDGEAIASAELVDPATGTAEALPGELSEARLRPMLLLLDDGSVLVAGGCRKRAACDGDDCVADARCRPDDEAVREVERFDPAGGRFEAAGALPAHDETVASALEGERVASFGCTENRCELHIGLPGGELSWHRALSGDAFPGLGDAGGLTQLRMLTLCRGRLLITGRTSEPPQMRRAFLVDLERDEVSEPESSRVPAHLLSLADGTVAELDEFGASLSRLCSGTPLDDAPDDALQLVALDLPERWRRAQDGELTARDDARLDIPELRFLELAIELELAGSATLLLEPSDAPAFEIGIGGEPQRGTCALEAPSGLVRITRTGTRVTVSDRTASVSCTASELASDVGIALRVARDSRLHALRIRRVVQ